MNSTRNPTAAEQLSILAETWHWLPYMECSLLYTTTPSFTYLITSMEWNGYVKTFSLRPLTDPRGEALHGVTECDLVLPREEDCHFARPYRQHTPVWPAPSSSKRWSGGGADSDGGGLKVGRCGMALGIGVQTPLHEKQHALYESVGGINFHYPPPQRRFGGERYSNSGGGAPGKYGGGAATFSGSSSCDEKDRRRGRTRRNHARGDGERRAEGRDDGRRGRAKESAGGRKADGRKKEKEKVEKGRTQDEDNSKKERRASISPSPSATSNQGEKN